MLVCAAALRADANHRPPTRLRRRWWQPCERRFAVRGPVAKGYGRGGKKLGFATPNLDSDVIGDVLGDLEKGVYAAFYQTAASEEPKRAVVNVGVAPTFGEEQPVKLVEAHLLDHDGRTSKDALAADGRLHPAGDEI